MLRAVKERGLNLLIYNTKTSVVKSSSALFFFLLSKTVEMCMRGLSIGQNKTTFCTLVGLLIMVVRGKSFSS